MKTVISTSHPIQTRWYHVFGGKLCFAVLRPPEFALGLEFRRDELANRREIALSLIFPCVVFQWEKRRRKS